MKSSLVSLSAAALASILATGALAQPVSSLGDGRSGKIQFESITPAGFNALVRRVDSPKAIIVGELTLPPGSDKVPAMVIAHGSSGVSDAREGRWAARFTDLGIAGFVVDSFSPRGIKNTASDQSQLSPAANVADALAALKLLATHPRIDPQRIGVIGFSRGGQVAIYTALDPIRRGIIGDALHFAAHVPFYPPCNTIYVSEKVTGAPIRFELGGADDYTPASYCTRYVEWFRSKGVIADSVTYDGAYHMFDTSQRVVFINSLQTARNCDALYDVDRNAIERLDTREMLRGPEEIGAYFRGCGSRGATVGGDSRAGEKAAADVAAFLKQVFRL